VSILGMVATWITFRSNEEKNVTWKLRIAFLSFMFLQPTGKTRNNKNKIKIKNKNE